MGTCAEYKKEKKQRVQTNSQTHNNPPAHFCAIFALIYNYKSRPVLRVLAMSHQSLGELRCHSKHALFRSLFYFFFRCSQKRQGSGLQKVRVSQRTSWKNTAMDRFQEPRLIGYGSKWPRAPAKSLFDELERRFYPLRAIMQQPRGQRETNEYVDALNRLGRFFGYL